MYFYTALLFIKKTNHSKQLTVAVLLLQQHIMIMTDEGAAVSNQCQEHPALGMHPVETCPANLLLFLLLTAPPLLTHGSEWLGLKAGHDE